MEPFEIKVGDIVSSRFGRTVVENIERCSADEKYGMQVKSIMSNENGVIDLDNGHFAYPDQIYNVEKHEESVTA